MIFKEVCDLQSVAILSGCFDQGQPMLLRYLSPLLPALNCRDRDAERSGRFGQTSELADHIFRWCLHWMIFPMIIVCAYIYAYFVNDVNVENVNRMCVYTHHG